MSESDLQARTAKESSHRDINCKEQKNRPDGRDEAGDSGRTGRAGVVKANIGGYSETDRRRNDFEGRWQTAPRTESDRVWRQQHRRKLQPDPNNPLDRAKCWNTNVGGVQSEPGLVQLSAGNERQTPAPRIPNRGSKWGDYNRRCLSPNRDDDRDRDCFWNRVRGGYSQNKASQRIPEQRTVRQAGVVPNGKTGEGGVFSNPEEQFGAKSQFNKEKWLPMVYTPVMISHYCCFKMKKSPMKAYQHKNKLYPILGTLAVESRVRKQAWIRHGCNAFESASPTSQPLSFWTEQDILAYIVKYNLPIASVYGEIVNEINGTEYPAVDMLGNIGCNLKCTGCDRTGCIFCGFGFHLEKNGETRFQRLAKTHPRQYEYSIGGGQWVDNPYFDATAPEYDGDWKNWNPKKIWVPSKKGLGMGKVFDMVNEIYGKEFYRYE